MSISQKEYDVLEYVIRNKESIKMMMDLARVSNPKEVLQDHLIHIFSKKDLTTEDIYVSMDNQVIDYLVENYFGGKSDKNQIHTEEQG